MISRHLNDQPAPPSTVAPHPIPAELEGIILGRLRKQPGERPQDAEMLSRLLAAVPVEPWTEDQAAEWWRNREDVLSSRSVDAGSLITDH